jgi:hypothetical protein
VDIVQAAGRAFRKDRSKPNKVGYVVVPILHKPGEELASIVETSSFKNVVRILQALGSADERLVAELSLGREAAERQEKEIEDDRKPKISIEGIADTDLSKKVFSEIVKKSSTRLKSLLYTDFDSAIEAIRKARRDRPSHVSTYFLSTSDYNEKGLVEDIGIGFYTLKTLAIRSGQPRNKTSAIHLAKLIWGKENKQDFFAVTETIRIAHPSRPNSFSSYFRNRYEFKEKGLLHDTGIGYTLLKKLAVESGFSVDITSSEIANLIWAVEDKRDFSSMVETIKKVHPNRPSSVSHYFTNKRAFKENGLIKDIGIGYGTLKKLAIKSGLATEKTMSTELADLIWGKEDKFDFKSAVEAIKKSRPHRPSPVSRYFANQNEFNGKGLKEDIGISYKLLKKLAVESSHATEQTTLTQLADLIWGTANKQDFISAVEAIKKAQPNRPSPVSSYFTSMNEFKENGLIQDIGIGYQALKKIAIKSGLVTEKTISTELADLIWGKEDKFDFRSAVEAINKVRPNRPHDPSSYFNSTNKFKGKKGLIQDIGIGYIALKKLAIESGQATEQTTSIQLADLIWD